jgi:hypothetical protein
VIVFLNLLTAFSFPSLLRLQLDKEGIAVSGLSAKPIRDRQSQSLITTSKGRGLLHRAKPVSESVNKLRRREEDEALTTLETYSASSEKVKETKRNLLSFFIETKQQRKTIAAYGAAGKGDTLLNYCGIRTDFLDYAVDRNPYKRGKFTSGTHIPIFHPDKIKETKPDYVFILPWNF